MHEYRYKYGDKPLEGYTIQRAAGRGGFGEVYYAISDSGRQVALKTVQNHEHIELRGIKQCMNLKSPHLVSIFDVKHNAQGKPFVIMEFVSGMSLRDLMNESPGGLGVQKSAFFLREIAKGLSHLHECGIVHRDLKPSNIFYENGYAKIGDYGLTKAISNTRRTEQTVTVGTVHYMAPEIGEGKYDFSIDIYALGILLYEMLTGDVPFFGASPAEILMKHLSQEPDLSGLDATFARVIKKALAKDPDERYETVQAMVEDVFGTEHIRQSVSQFSPDSLSIVADHVAAKAKTAQAEAKKAQTRPPTPGRANENLSSLGETIGRRIGTAGDRLAERIAQAGSGVKGQSPQQIQDSIGRVQRYILAIITVVIMSLGVGALTHDGIGMGSLIMTLGAIAGISLMRWHFLRHAEPGQWRNWFAGGLGIFLGILFSGGLFRTQPPSLIIPIIALCFVDWWKLTKPTRRERVVWGPAIGCGLVGFFLAGLFHGIPIASAGVIVGTIIGIQIISPFGTVASASPTDRNGRSANRFHRECQTRWQTFVDRRHERSQASQAATPAPGTPGATAQSPLAGRQRVPSWLRMLFLLGVFLTLGTSLFAFISLGAMRLGQGDQTACLCFGFGGLVAFFTCLGWSCKSTFKSWYRFLVKPAVQLFLLIIVIIFSCLIGNTHGMGNEETAATLFLIIFPAILFFVVLFTPSRLVEEITGLTPVEDLSASRGGNTMSPKSRLAALLFCLIPMPAGCQRFYAGKIKTGLLWLFTGGLFGIGQFIDLILILSGGFRDDQGRLIFDWNPGANSTPLSPSPEPANTASDPAPNRVTPPPMPEADSGVQNASTPMPSQHGSSYVWQAVEEFNPIGRLLSGLGFVLLFAATVGGLFFALHVPWFVSAGFPNPEVGEAMQDFFKYAEWPNLVESLGITACVLVCLTSLALIITGRRKAGPFHIIRAIIGVTALVIGLLVFSEMIPTYYFKTSDRYTLPSYQQERRDEFRQILDNKETGRAVGYLVDHVDMDMAILGASLTVVSVITMAWPARRQAKQLHAAQTYTV
ncbi:MAG: protein kinase [Planctomycetes bacterium]|nr:protein kinase [Planctomycetota bacterium]